MSNRHLILHKLHLLTAVLLFVPFCLASIPGLTAEPAVPALNADKPASAEDALIYARIQQYLQIADRIKIDGSDNDWAGIPTFSAVTKPTDIIPNDPTRQITQVAIAPREADLLVLIKTARYPSKDEFAFGLGIDFTGTIKKDYRLNFGYKKDHALLVTGQGEQTVTVPLSDVRVRRGNAVEIQIPYQVLTQYLPAAMASALYGPQARSWVRVFPYTWNGIAHQVVDEGASVASYRLLASRYPLDPPLPSPTSAPQGIPLPVLGQWYVSQGPFTGTHEGHWAVDMDIRDDTLSASGVRGSVRNEDYYCWQKPIFSPIAARVTNAKRGFPDNLPAAVAPGSLFEQGNQVGLDIGKRVRLVLTHFKKDSIPSDVVPGAVLGEGTPLGYVGNSGQSSYAHLHVALWALPEVKATLPLAFTKVRVSLNPSLDPWSRQVAAWQPREGFFVERSDK